MATPAQIRANRANAQRSSGPRSEAGREIAKMNALKHGLAAKELVIPGEDPAALDALRADLVAEHQPAGTTEAMLVEDLAICWWRLQRARLHEAAMIDGSIEANRPYAPECMGGILRYATAAERAWNRALANLRAAQNDRLKRETANTESASAPQPTEKEKVMAIGSVLQNGPEPPPSPETNLESPSANPAATEPSARKVALGAQFIALEAGANAFVAQGRKEMAQFRKTYGGV